MFKKKCFNCRRKVGKKYDFCPYCGAGLIGKNSEDDYGFLGKNDLKDFNDIGIKLPIGFNTLMKPLMKELVKQMNALDKELMNEKQPVNINNDKPGQFKTTSFSIHIGMPGQKPIKIISSNNGRTHTSFDKEIKPKNIKLPKISSEDLGKLRKLIKKEPRTNVRRLADRVLYEISLPNVKSLKNINIVPLEGSVEVKAFSDKDLFVKKIDINMPLVGYSFDNEMLVLELLAK